MKTLLITALLMSSSSYLLASPKYENSEIQSEQHSNVIDDLNKMQIDKNDYLNKQIDFITLTKDENFVYFYFYHQQDINIKNVVLSSSDELNKDNYYINDEFNIYNIELVSSEANFYKYTLDNKELLNTNRIVIASASYNNTNFDINQSFIFNKELSYRDNEINIELSKAYNRYITANETVDGKTQSCANVLSYIFFNTSIDSIIDQITDITVKYDYFTWSAQLDYNSILSADADRIITKNYDDLKNDSNLKNFKQSSINQVIKSITDTDKVNVTKTSLFGKKIYNYDCLFDVSSQASDNWLYENGGDNMYGCLFNQSKQSYRINNGSFDFAVSDEIVSQSAILTYDLKGEHVTECRILTISYIAQNNFYRNVAVYDEHKTPVDTDPERPGNNQEQKKSFLDKLLDFLNSISNGNGTLILAIIIGVLIFAIIFSIIKVFKRNSVTIKVDNTKTKSSKSKNKK